MFFKIKSSTYRLFPKRDNKNLIICIYHVRLLQGTAIRVDNIMFTNANANAAAKTSLVFL